MSIFSWFRPRRADSGQPSASRPEKPNTEVQTVVSAVYQDLVSKRITVDRVHDAIELAEMGDPRDLYAIYDELVIGDPHVQGEIAKRKLAVLGDTMSILPSDLNDRRSVAAADLVKAQLDKLHGMSAVMSHLLDGALWPCSVVEKVYRRAGRGYELAALVPVPHRLQDFTQGHLRIRATDCDGRPTSEFFDAYETHYVIHVGHLLTSSPCKGGPMRSLLFWTLFSVMDRDWWIRFLDKFGTPFLVGKHEAGDENGRGMLLRAINGAAKLVGIVVTKEIELTAERVESGSMMADSFKVFAEFARAEQSKLIVGQTLSATPAATGLGSGVANLQGEVRDDIRRFDAQTLSRRSATRSRARCSTSMV